jgi:hypothetical protein
MRLLLLFTVAFALCAESRFPFTTSQRGEVVATIEMSSPDADWAKRGREAAVAAVSLNGKPNQHVILYAGPKRYGYRVSLGLLGPGEHEITVERDAKHSAAGAGFEAHEVKIEEIGTGSPQFDVYASAPVLYARLNTVGRFSDIPLLLYCERSNGLTYTVIFSNEDGGTSTRTLMGRWGRTTDIEYVYRQPPGGARAIVQGPGHQDVEFTGAYDGTHPLLMPVTDNNMIAGAKDSPLAFRLAPVLVDLTVASREEIMDRHPETYAVMGKELERENKLRPFGVAAGEKISDPRNYLFVDYSAHLTNAAVTVAVQTTDGQIYASDFGRGDVAIHRDGNVRTTVELPAGAKREQIAGISFECRVVPPAKGETWAHSGSCVIDRVPKVFLLKDDYTPGPSILSRRDAVTLRTGRGASFKP